MDDVNGIGLTKLIQPMLCGCLICKLPSGP